MRVAVCGLLALGYLVVTAGIWVFGQTANEPMMGVVPGPSPLVLNWLLVVLGVITHYAVDRSKANKSGGATAIPLGHLTYAVDARAGVIIMKGLLMLVGFFGLLFLAPGTPGHLDFFLVGYSLDSFVGIVSLSLDQRAAARGAEVAKKIGG